MANWLAAVGQGLGEATKNISALMTDEKQREAITQNIAASKSQQAIAEADAARKQREEDYMNEQVNARAWFSHMPEKARNRMEGFMQTVSGYDQGMGTMRRKDFKGLLETIDFRSKAVKATIDDVNQTYNEEIQGLREKQMKLDKTDPQYIKIQGEIDRLGFDQKAIVDGYFKAKDEQEKNELDKRRVAAQEEQIKSHERIAEEGRKTQKEIANTPQRAPQLNPLQQLEYDTVKGMSETERKQYFLNKGLKANLPEVIQSKKDEAVSKSVDKHMSGWIGVNEKNTKEVEAFVRRKTKATGAQNPDQKRAETIIEYYKDETKARQATNADISYFNGYKSALGISSPGTIQVAYPKGSNNMVTVPVPTSGRMRPDNLEAYAYYYLDELKKKQGK